jgi:hypothetical protein
MIQRKGVTKGDIVRSIKAIEQYLTQMQQHILLIDNLLDKYISMKKDRDKLLEYMKNEHKQSERKQGRRSSTTSK